MTWITLLKKLFTPRNLIIGIAILIVLIFLGQRWYINSLKEKNQVLKQETQMVKQDLKVEREVNEIKEETRVELATEVTNHQETQSSIRKKINDRVAAIVSGTSENNKQSQDVNRLGRQIDQKIRGIDCTKEKEVRNLKSSQVAVDLEEDIKNQKISKARIDGLWESFCSLETNKTSEKCKQFLKNQGDK